MKFKDTLDQQQKPKVIENLYHMVKTGAECFGDKALYYYDRNGEEHVFTYQDLFNHVNWFGTSLSSIDLFGKTVAVVGDTCPEYIATYLSVVN